MLQMHVQGETEGVRLGVSVGTWVKEAHRLASTYERAQ